MASRFNLFHVFTQEGTSTLFTASIVGKYLFSVHFSSEIKARILDRFLLVVGFIKAVGEILASAK